MEYCAREALQVFGGAGYTRTGQGEKAPRKLDRTLIRLRWCPTNAAPEKILKDAACQTLKALEVELVIPEPQNLKAE